MDTGHLKGKVALVTGASKGIGRAIALRLGAEGALVAVNFSSSERDAERVVQSILDAGGKAFSLQCHLHDATSVERLIGKMDAKLINQTGTTDVDILVNNLGDGPYSPMSVTTEDIYDEVFAKNVKVPFFLVKHLLQRMRVDSRIINISSAVARLNWTDFPAYSMAKAAQNKLTVLLAKELGARGIHVNSIAPGIVETETSKHALADPERRQNLQEQIVLGRFGQPHEIADLVCMLASPTASLLTGQIIEASGGHSL